MSSPFERYLTLWVGLCIVSGIILGKIAPGLARTLDGMAIYVKGAPVVSIPIAVCLFFMMYPIMVKIDFASVVKAGKSGKPVLLTLFVNWCIKPFTMYGLGLLFLGVLFRGLIGEATDLLFCEISLLALGTTTASVPTQDANSRSPLTRIRPHAMARLHCNDVLRSPALPRPSVSCRGPGRKRPPSGASVSSEQRPCAFWLPLRMDHRGKGGNVNEFLTCERRHDYRLLTTLVLLFS